MIFVLALGALIGYSDGFPNMASANNHIFVTGITEVIVATICLILAVLLYLLHKEDD